MGLYGIYYTDIIIWCVKMIIKWRWMGEDDGIYEVVDDWTNRLSNHHQHLLTIVKDI